MKYKALVTGGSGFIGSCLIRLLIKRKDFEVLNVDSLTYAAHPYALQEVQELPSYRFIQANICDHNAITEIIEDFQPQVIFHLAAESHVDRSIASSDPFIHSNIVGTHSLLKASYSYWKNKSQPNSFRFLHVSTDEVYGSLNFNDLPANENSPYKPSSPYSASKASSDLLVNAWHATYRFPALITHCTNNYGEYQHDEKLIPTIIRSAIQGLPIPIYGNGQNIRDWLYVEDHCRALIQVFQMGRVGECYNISGSASFSNVQMAYKICSLLDELKPKNDKSKYCCQISYVEDRLGHDLRYAVDDSKIKDELGWERKFDFEDGIKKTVIWFLREYHERDHFSGRQRDTPISSDKLYI